MPPCCLGTRSKRRSRCSNRSGAVTRLGWHRRQLGAARPSGRHKRPELGCPRPRRRAHRQGGGWQGRRAAGTEGPVQTPAPISEGAPPVVASRRRQTHYLTFRVSASAPSSSARSVQPAASSGARSPCRGGSTSPSPGTSPPPIASSSPRSAGAPPRVMSRCCSSPSGSGTGRPRRWTVNSSTSPSRRVAAADGRSRFRRPSAASSFPAARHVTRACSRGRWPSTFRSLWFFWSAAPGATPAHPPAGLPQRLGAGSDEQTPAARPQAPRHQVLEQADDDLRVPRCAASPPSSLQSRTANSRTAHVPTSKVDRATSALPRPA